MKFNGTAKLRIECLACRDDNHQKQANPAPKKTLEHARVHTHTHTHMHTHYLWLVRFDPRERLTIQELLSHEYFENLHCEEDEPDGIDIELDLFEFERGGSENAGRGSMEIIKQEILKEINYHHPPIRSRP